MLLRSLADKKIQRNQTKKALFHQKNDNMAVKFSTQIQFIAIIKLKLYWKYRYLRIPEDFACFLPFGDSHIITAVWLDHCLTCEKIGLVWFYDV